MSNVGKRFEQQVKKSCPPYLLMIRLNDPPQSFNNTAKFSIKNPCDYIEFDSKHRILVPMEYKTTKLKSMSFEDVNSDEEQNRMIHKHQIVGLTKFSKYDNVAAGFLFCFRDEENDMQRCYWQNVVDFNNMVRQINKKSFNELDLLAKGNPIKVSGEKKRVNYIWDIDGLLNEIYARDEHLK